MEFDWTTLLWIGAFALLFWFMMRACGGMMRGAGAGGGCGMGGGRENCEREEAAEDELPGPERKRE